MTPTINQLARKNRKLRKKKNKVKWLFGRPQKKVLVYQIAIQSPRKPNSAKRKLAKVRVLGGYNGKRAFAHIPGCGFHGLHEFSVVLMEGGSPPDLPGVNYSLIRGSIDFILIEKHRVRRRSKFGIKRADVVRNDKFYYPSWWGNINHPKHPKKMENAY